MCGYPARDLPRFPKNKVHARVKRGDFEAKCNAGQRFHGIHHVFTRWPTESRREIIQPIRGRPQFLYAACILGIPLARRTQINLATKSVRQEKGILDVRVA